MAAKTPVPLLFTGLRISNNVKYYYYVKVTKNSQAMFLKKIGEIDSFIAVKVYFASREERAHFKKIIIIVS